MICCMDVFLLNVLEGRELGYFVGSFYGTGDDIGDTCLCLLVGGIITDSEIYAIHLNYSSYVSCKS